MNLFLRDAVITVITSTLNELIVLSHGKHLCSKGDADRKPLQTPQLQMNILHAATLNEIKLSNDVKKLIDIYLETVEEIESSGTIKTMLAIIKKQIEKDEKEESLIEQHNANMSVLKGIKSKLAEFKSKADARILQVSETLNNLKSDWRIISKINELEYELVRKWENTRFTQATIVGEKDEENLRTIFATFVTRSEAEQSVIVEFQEFSKLQFGKYLEMIEMWKLKYTKEFNELLDNIADKEKIIKEVNKTYDKHHEIYCKRKEFIEEYLEQKAEQNRLLELQTKRIESAVKIQAWWRGLMVRKCLGPFRKKTKKSKKAKKSK